MTTIVTSSVVVRGLPEDRQGIFLDKNGSRAKQKTSALQCVGLVVRFQKLLPVRQCILRQCEIDGVAMLDIEGTLVRRSCHRKQNSESRDSHVKHDPTRSLTSEGSHGPCSRKASSAKEISGSAWPAHGKGKEISGLVLASAGRKRTSIATEQILSRCCVLWAEARPQRIHPDCVYPPLARLGSAQFIARVVRCRKSMLERKDGTSLTVHSTKEAQEGGPGDDPSILV